MTQSTAQPKFKNHKKKVAIQSFLYHAPKAETVVKKTIEVKPVITKALEKKPEQKKKNSKEAKKKSSKTKNPNKTPKPIVESGTDKNNKQEIKLPPIPIEQSLPKPQQLPKLPRKKLDTFTQLQRLRSKLNRSASRSSNNPYQRYQPPSAFNSNSKAVPHSVPLNNEEKERERNTHRMGAGIAITKNDNGTCSITQDMSAYGLSEGSSTQYFTCGESKFDKSFREHMKKVNKKLGK